MSIDNSTLGTNGARAKTVDVNYHYKIATGAGWANSQEMKTAYWGHRRGTQSNPSDRATLIIGLPSGENRPVPLDRGGLG